MTLSFNLLAQQAAELGFGVRQIDNLHYDLYAIDSNQQDHNQSQLSKQQLLDELAQIALEQQR
ncbi:hypothetical protein [uncultured Ferrimonas sp.]|uniref:hypothetical protein n=1 Tax=uncultured Ferrimonas sp. TaxID=432640 RepID=UPI0026219A27|nr:hypothetical protein [uncultured Ferrimonas sp.]